MRKMTAMLASCTMGAMIAASCSAHAAPPRMVPLNAVQAPRGYVDFCAREPDACKATNAAQEIIHMDATRWRAVSRMNSHINQTVISGNDIDLFGQAEHWTIAQGTGDCEDYVLLKKQQLEAEGYPSSALLITVVLDERQEGHAVLTIATDTGDYILDNRRDDILPFTSTGYQFLKRQSQFDPQRWVSLAGIKATTSGAVASHSP